MTDLTHLISSTVIAAQCPRELLGRLCIADSYMCFCEHVAASTAEWVYDESGARTALRLTMTLNPKGDVMAVVNGIELMGLQAQVGGTNKVVDVKFNLHMPQNAQLRGLTFE